MHDREARGGNEAGGRASAARLTMFASACLEFQSAAEGGLAVMVEPGVHMLPRGLSESLGISSTP